MGWDTPDFEKYLRETARKSRGEPPEVENPRRVKLWPILLLGALTGLSLLMGIVPNISGKALGWSFIVSGVLAILVLKLRPKKQQATDFEMVSSGAPLFAVAFLWGAFITLVYNIELLFMYPVGERVWSWIDIPVFFIGILNLTLGLIGVIKGHETDKLSVY